MTNDVRSHDFYLERTFRCFGFLFRVKVTAALRSIAPPSTPAHAQTVVNLHFRTQGQFHNQIGQTVQRHIVAFERLALLRELIGDLNAGGEPAGT